MVKILSLLVLLVSLVVLVTSVVICPRTPLLSIESARSQSDNVIIDGSYNPDAITKKHSWKRQPLLVLLLCLCKHFKDLPKLPQLVKIVRKRMQRYNKFLNPQNNHGTFFKETRRKSKLLTKIKKPIFISIFYHIPHEYYTLLYIGYS